jgi:hypothetical protein
MIYSTAHCLAHRDAIAGTVRFLLRIVAHADRTGNDKRASDGSPGAKRVTEADVGDGSRCRSLGPPQCIGCIC